MMINLWVVRFEDHEVKAGWKHAVEFSKKVVEKSKPVAVAAVDTTLKYAVIGSRYAADGVVIAADALQDVREQFNKR